MTDNKILVCGGRDWMDVARLFEVLDILHTAKPFSLLIHGGARGADTQSGAWAGAKNIPQRVFPADWKTHGKAAGPIRNQQMLDETQPDVVVAFSTSGPGTTDMIKRCSAGGVRCIVVSGVAGALLSKETVALPKELSP